MGSELAPQMLPPRSWGQTEDHLRGQSALLKCRGPPGMARGQLREGGTRRVAREWLT